MQQSIALLDWYCDESRAAGAAGARWRSTPDLLQAPPPPRAPPLVSHSRPKCFTAFPDSPAPPPPCKSYGLVQATAGVGTIVI